MKKLILIASLFASQLLNAVDFELIEKQLQGDGLQGWVHGAVPSTQIYVFTYRNPENFFDNIQLSLIPKTDAENTILLSLNRHDKVSIKGTVMDNPSPQKHILVSEIKIVEKYDSQNPTEDYQYDDKVPEELQKLTEAEFLVHAIAAEGKILVVEFKDSVFPIFVRNNSLTQNLYRNDIVQLKFKIQIDPDRPMHLALNEKAEEPVKVIQSALSFQGKPADIEGRLVMFPKSPEIRFNIFAVEDTSHSGFKRQYTLLNQTDMNVFTQIREKLQAAWDFNPIFINGRNKLISVNVRVRAKGTFQVVDANQANMQILLDTPDSVTITGQ